MRLLSLVLTLAAAFGSLGAQSRAGANVQSPAAAARARPRERGASITPAYEGWFQNPDGSFSLLIGYFNRNRAEALDIPVGPNNRIEPGAADQGQPTHFADGPATGASS